MGELKLSMGYFNILFVSFLDDSRLRKVFIEINNLVYLKLIF